MQMIPRVGFQHVALSLTENEVLHPWFLEDEGISSAFQMIFKHRDQRGLLLGSVRNAGQIPLLRRIGGADHSQSWLMPRGKDEFVRRGCLRIANDRQQAAA